MNGPDRLLSPSELADYLGVPLATLYAWRYRGEGPRGFRVGKHLRYRWSDVEAWIEGQLEDDRPRPGPVSHPRGRVAGRGPSRPREARPSP